MKEAKFKDNNERAKAYNAERNDRWSLEDVLLEPVAQLICELINNKVADCSYLKYANNLISKFQKENPELALPDEIRGAPDLQLIAGHNIRYVELKIKRSRFANTLEGTATIPKYDCYSHYLDDIPVYRNLLKFSHYYKIDPCMIILLYAYNPRASQSMALPLTPTDWDFEGITLDQLSRNIDAKRYALYSGGYGKATWLIRCDDLASLEPLIIT